MKRERIGQLVFLISVAGGLAFYALTIPDGVPWNLSTHFALAYLGEIVKLPTMVNAVWGRLVQVFGGNVALACACASLGAGLLAAIVNRHFGWRMAASAAIVWIFAPGIWNRAITGERSVCIWSMGMALVWVLNVVGLRLTRKARAARKVANVDGTSAAHEVSAKRAKTNRIVGWSMLGMAGVFAVVSMSCHDYRIGEAASAFARGVVEEAAGRIIVSNGICNDQMEFAAKKFGEDNQVRVIVLRNDAEYRRELLAWIKREWPTETNLWVSAEIGPMSFVQNAVRRYPKRFYLMNGMSTTIEGWEKRMVDFTPYLRSTDKFVMVAKLAFAHEGKMLADRLARNGDMKGASRIRKQLPKVEKNVRKRVVREVADGKIQGISPEILSLIEWNNEMLASMERNELEKAGRIARMILSNPRWVDFIPANAVMGTITAAEGNYLSSAEFFKVAVSTTNSIPPVTLNDYADTLMHLERLEEAERVARKAVSGSDEKFWLARFTLAEILKARYMRVERVETIKNDANVECYKKPEGSEAASREIHMLLKTVLAHAPAEVREQVHKMQRDLK